MMIVAHGIDLVHLPRLERVWTVHGERFLARVFTPVERTYCLARHRAAVHLAGRFAVKEAVMKVLGTGWSRGLQWTDIETVAGESGRPEVRLLGRAAELAAERGITQVLVSITHAGEYAQASALGLGSGH